MKHYLLLLSIIFVSCNKEDNASPSVDGLMVNDIALTPTSTFAVGQYLNIQTSRTNNLSNQTLSWTLSPEGNEVIEIDNAHLNWRPGKAQHYTLGVKVQASSGQETSRQYAFNIIPADIRYYLWGVLRTEVENSETASLSENVASGDVYVQYIVKHSDVQFARKDAVQPGESVFYRFENDRLSGADVYNVMLNQTDPNVYYEKYQTIKSRLSEYRYLGNENKWLEQSAEAMQYKNTPERWGEAFAKGYVTLCDRFDNDRTNIRLESNGSANGDLLIVIRYSQKK